MGTPDPGRLAAGVAALALVTAVAPASAPAASVAVVTAAGISVVGTDGARTAVAGPDDWYNVAYSGDGRLFATRSNGQGCDLVDTATGDVVITGEQAISQIDRSQGLCRLSSDPAGGLLFGADNGSAGSTATFRLDLRDNSITRAASGYAASASTDGTIVTVRHRYFRTSGSYEQPWLRTPGGASRPLAPAPPSSLRSGMTFQAVAISRDGRRVAATGVELAHRFRPALVFGPASGRLKTVAWRLLPGRSFAGVSWLSGDTVVAGVLSSTSARSYTLHTLRLATHRRSQLVSGVTAFATR